LNRCPYGGFTIEEIMAKETIIRSSFTPDGQRVFLEFDAERKVYRIGTRWNWLIDFANIWDACDAYEAIEFMEGDLRQAAKLAKAEIARVPRHQFTDPNSMGRIRYLINSIERRLAGLRPIRTGSKGSIESWVAA
jgi:hypothetical protein